MHILSFNPVANRNAKIAYNFGLSECNRVKSRPLFLKDFMAKGSKQEVTENVTLGKNGRKHVVLGEQNLFFSSGEAKMIAELLPLNIYPFAPVIKFWCI